MARTKDAAHSGATRRFGTKGSCRLRRPRFGRTNPISPVVSRGLHFTRSHSVPILDRRSLIAGAACALMLLPLRELLAADAASGGAELIRTYCSGCHQPASGGFARISAM